MADSAGRAPEQILPFADAEVAEVLQRLLASDELLGGMGAFRYPGLYAIAPWLVRPIVRMRLSRQVRGITTVRDFQASLEPLFEWLVERTTDGFTFSGTDNLSAGQGYVFVSNHRDIALDSAFLNYALWLAGHDTVRIGIGDNLLGRWYVTDLMRLNKSFVIPRSSGGGKAMYQAFAQTSAYIYESVADGQSVWIAQREGRAKDGLDRTDAAVVKMLQMSRRKTGESFAEAVAQLKIVPVSISYEIDPCDVAKARELSIVERCGRYEKIGDEDLRSIVNGIAGYKGRVHVHFGKPIHEPGEDAEQVAAQIDRQIVGSYRLYPTHRLAWCELGNAEAEVADVEADSPAAERLTERLALCDADFQPYLLGMYANPIRNRAALRAQ